MIRLVQTALLLSSCITYGMPETMTSCSCEGAIGDKPATLDPSPLEYLSGLFLNTHPDSRAPCNGIVMAWDFCYHVLDNNITLQQTNESIRIQAGVWREQNNSEYQFLNDSLIELPIPPPARGFQFVCRHWSLVNSTHDARFEVQEGDIVGVYVDDVRIVYVLGGSVDGAQDNRIMRAVNIADIETPVSDLDLNSTSYSLYLKAIMENSTCPCTCPDPPNTLFIPPSTPLTITDSGMDPTAATTVQPTFSATTVVQNAPADNHTSIEKSWEYYVIGGLVFLLLVTVIGTICGLVYLRKRNKGSEPVLIKKMKTGKQKTRRILMTSQEPGAVGQHAVGNAESEAGDRDSSPHRSQHPVAQLLQPQSPLFNSDGSQTPPQQQDDDIASPASPPPVVFAASFDIEQQSDDEQESDRFKFKPSHQNPGHTKPQRIGLIPIKDLKRSHSATDALNISGCPYTASTEYPYVLHAFEVVGRSPTHIGSLPNILEHRFLEDQATNPCTNEVGNPNGTADFQVDTATDDSNSDTDDEPSYSYADRRHMTAKDLPPRKSKLPSIVEPAANQDYHYDEYPSAWNPTSQLLQSVSQYSDEHTTDTHDQTEPSALPSNQVLPQNQNNNGTQDNPLPPKPKVKPPIKPRKKLAYQIKPNHAILHFPTGVNTATEKGHQPPSSSLVIPNKGSTNEAGAGARLAAQTGPTYMKLLETTKDEHHRYTYLFDGANGLGERSLSNLDPERAHPNEWCKLAKC